MKSGNTAFPGQTLETKGFFVKLEVMKIFNEFPNCIRGLFLF